MLSGVLDGDSKRAKKLNDITQALSLSPVDVAALRRMAISEGGLLTDDIRCQVWPRLLNVPLHILDEEPGTVAAAKHMVTFTATALMRVSDKEAINMLPANHADAKPVL